MEITREMIERKAYELYLARGGEHGADVNDWLEAERQLRAEMEPPAKPSRTAPATSRKVSANKTTRRR
jgi:DUF2934 family protein